MYKDSDRFIKTVIVIGVACFITLLAVIFFFGEEIFAHIPYVGNLVRGLGKPMYIDASDWNKPITWDQLDEKPDGWYDGMIWFNYLNNYTRKKLKRYMKKNNLYIVPKEYELSSAMDLESVLEQLEFEPVPTD